MKITQYKGDFSSQKSVELSTLLESMRADNYSKPVRILRADLQYCSPGSQCLSLNKVPFIVFSAVFKKGKDTDQIMVYNGLVLLEINNLPGLAEVVTLREQASESLQTVAAFAGSGGKSLKILVSFTLPDGSLPQTPEQAQLFHAHAYRRAANFYSAQLQREVTLKRPLLKSGCRFSFDPDLYYNPEAIPIRIKQPLLMPAEATWQEVQQNNPNPYHRLLPGVSRSRAVSLLFETSLKETKETMGELDEEGDFKPFLVHLAQNCYRSGIPEEDAIKWISVHTDLFRYEMELRATIRNVYSKGKSFGEKPCVPSCQTLAARTEEFMKRRYEFRRNELKHEVEFRELASFYFDFLPITDEAQNGIGINAQKEGLNAWDRDVQRYIYSDKIPTHNPIHYYLDHLPRWDGTDRIRELADTLPVENSNRWREQFYRWFLSMVAHWKQMDQMHANSVLPLLSGSQGCGKSTWCRNLLPPVLREYYTDSIDFSTKRNAEQYLSRFALINIDEFDSISTSQHVFLKHLLQKPVVNFRQAYKSSIRLQKRYATFIATCNNTDLLSDPTGSRRFICIEIKGTISYANPIDYSQLYAQAVAALQAGERYWFTKEEEKEITQENNKFQKHSIAGQLFQLYFRAAKAEEEGEYLLAIEIIRRLEKRGGRKLSDTHVNVFGRELTKYGIPNKRTSKGNVVYHVAAI